MNSSQKIFKENRLKFIGLYQYVRGVHQMIVKSGASNHGHGFDHDLMVAQYGAIIAPDDYHGDMAWVAGLLHSFDRHFEEDKVHSLVKAGLDQVSHHFIPIEIQKIRIAIADHSKKNDDNDDLVTIILKDADRLANLGAINIIRGGQHRPNIPACIPETLGKLHPDSTFKDPKSCYDATFYNLEWRDMMRLPKVKELGERYFNFIREWQSLAVSQATEVGLYPWPD